MKRIYYWDSSVWIAWLKGEAEDHTDEERAGLAASAMDIADGEALMACSVVVVTETLEGHMTKAQAATFEEFFNHPRRLLFDVSITIARVASDIRNHCSMADPVISCPKPADAIHLATAIAGGATEMHSFDPHIYKLDGRLPMNNIPLVKPRGTKKQLTLLSGDGNAEDQKAKENLV